jgi:hypothetical protein
VIVIIYQISAEAMSVPDLDRVVRDYVRILEENVDKVYWTQLSTNRTAIHILEKIDKVSWYNLSKNSNAIQILEEHLDWHWLSANRNAIPILEQHLDKVDWFWFTKNSNAIHFLKLDTIKMRKTNKCFAEELVSVVFHPMRLNSICETYNIDLEDLVDMY